MGELVSNPVLSDELGRLAAVRRYDVLDTPPDGSFDRITKIAASIFGVPIALVTVVDEDRIWFKSRYGLDGVQEIPRDPGLCASAICQAEPYVIEQARADPRSLANPLVAGEFGLQFYAAAPLRTHDGYNLGTLCIIDRQPRQISPDKLAILETLAGVVVDELELRLRALRAIAAERQLQRAASAQAVEKSRLYEHERQIAETLQRAMVECDFPKIDNYVFSATYIPATSEALIGGDWYDAVSLDNNRFLISIGDVTGHGLQAAVLMSKLRQSLRTLSLHIESPSEILQALEAVLRQDSSERIATAFVGIVNVEEKCLTFATAGHPPPFKRSSDGCVHALSAVGQPLGMGIEPKRESSSLSLNPGDLLVLYTDGLTEATRNIFEGERLLIRAIEGVKPNRWDRVADDLSKAVLSHGSSDDVAVLTVGIA
ncbi:MAG: SpoIIE family protein phosphatase [Candidatus Eremiobacteraeota bacterium]|nr:SpoIIE family protein phosphatase [Candidatus Eremiobacteraeota bacterium]